MPSENLFVTLCLALTPMGIKFRKRLNLMPEKNPSGILTIDAMRHLVFAREAKSYALENIEEEFIEVVRREAFEFLPALNYDVMITAGINFDVRTCAILRAPVSRKETA